MKKKRRRLVKRVKKMVRKMKTNPRKRKMDGVGLTMAFLQKKGWVQMPMYIGIVTGQEISAKNYLLLHRYR